MNRLVLVLLGGLLVASSVPGLVMAQTETEEQEVVDTETDLDEEASTPEGAQKVTQRLMDEFGVDEARINALRDQNMGYGEINHALSIAKQMPDGITDESINQIMTLRNEQKMGWGNISKEVLGDKLGSVVREGKAAEVPEVAGTDTSSGPQSLSREGADESEIKVKGAKGASSGAVSSGSSKSGKHGLSSGSAGGVTASSSSSGKAKGKGHNR